MDLFQWNIVGVTEVWDVEKAFLLVAGTLPNFFRPENNKYD